MCLHIEEYTFNDCNSPAQTTQVQGVDASGATSTLASGCAHDQEFLCSTPSVTWHKYSQGPSARRQA